MNKLICLLLSLSLGLPVAAAAQQSSITDLDQLLKSVKRDQQQEKQRQKEREAQFLRDKNRQQALLEKARSDYAREQRGNNPLINATEDNAREIESLKKQLEQRKQEMGDIYSIHNQFLGDFAAAMQQSMISVQLPQRGEQLQTLMNNRKLASMDELQALWLLVQEEMTEQGKVATFDAPVVTTSGLLDTRQVTRLGSFSAYGDNGFLRFVPETGEFLELDRQPAGRLLRDAIDFAQSQNSLQAAVIDPTGGSLLGMLSYAPNLRERIEQGGMIGYIIIALGMLGVLLTLWRVGYLGLVAMAIGRQLKNLQQPQNNNPLGRVLLAAREQTASPENDGEAMQYRLDEAVLAEVPPLERSHALIKLLAATSPLLGLLGTVTGMILTFQTISLFGSGDPKLMAGGISQALVTTVLGLVAAIPLLFGYSLVAAMASSIVQRLDEQSAGFMARLIEARLIEPQHKRGGE